MSEEKQESIKMYSTSWCPDCFRAKRVLKRLGVPFKEIDIDRDKEGRRLVLEFNHGQRIVPTIFFPDGSALVEPTNKELKEKLVSLGLGAEV